MLHRPLSVIFSSANSLIYPCLQSSLESSSFGHFYDLSQNLDSQLLTNINTFKFDPLDIQDEYGSDTNNILDHLFYEIKKVIEKGNFKPQANELSSK